MSLLYPNNRDRIITEALAGSYQSPVQFGGTAGEPLAYGEVAYRKAADSRWWLTDASVAAASGPVRLAIVLIGAQAGGSVRLSDDCWLRNDGWAWAVDVPLFLDVAVAGAMKTAAPALPGEIERAVGYSVAANIVRFRAPIMWVTVV